MQFQGSHINLKSFVKEAEEIKPSLAPTPSAIGTQNNSLSPAPGSTRESLSALGSHLKRTFSNIWPGSQSPGPQSQGSQAPGSATATTPMPAPAPGTPAPVGPAQAAPVQTQQGTAPIVPIQDKYPELKEIADSNDNQDIDLNRLGKAYKEFIAPNPQLSGQLKELGLSYDQDGKLHFDAQSAKGIKGNYLKDPANFNPSTGIMHPNVGMHFADEHAWVPSSNVPQPVYSGLKKAIKNFLMNPGAGPKNEQESGSSSFMGSLMKHLPSILGTAGVGGLMYGAYKLFGGGNNNAHKRTAIQNVMEPAPPQEAYTPGYGPESMQKMTVAHVKEAGIFSLPGLAARIMTRTPGDAKPVTDQPPSMTPHTIIRNYLKQKYGLH